MIVQVHTTDEIKNIVEDVIKNAFTNFQPVKVSTPDDFLTKEDVANMLQMSKSGIDNMRRRGLLKPYRIGATVRFKKIRNYRNVEPYQRKKTTSHLIHSYH